jgi:hypothetical protein
MRGDRAQGTGGRVERQNFKVQSLNLNKYKCSIL